MKKKKSPKFIDRPGRRTVPEREGDIRQARSRIGYLVRIGKLKPANKLACVRCGYKASEYHHTQGYGIGCHDIVEPVCKSCHAYLNGGYIPSDEPIPD